MKTSDRNTRVTVTRNGPYLVTGDLSLCEQTIGTDSDGESEEWIEKILPSPGPKFALCRCGHSNNKPFCDGSHARVGFIGTEVAARTMYLDQAEAFDGPFLALLDVESLCAFARFCDPKGQVWSQVAKTDDPEVRATFIRQVQNCPSGRLVVWDKARGSAIEPELAPSIGLIEDPAEGCSGPLWLRGGIAVVSADGEEYEVRNRMTLCRCGGSRNKPFCDGTHAAIKFRAK
ncbi:iron-binding protein [Mesorhizobium sp. B2-4-12]|uniref:CDGSH iron-sulfur domain-containing protein n=1 Tax=Mesorhizobium sp. B2-4-12 TaxID=2589937 RepID=UPI00112B4FD4|nr:CDGSH iron-sulfur domain-containing protein [Mesorhizobium sp. B2-4-12]TPK95564.1 iron-binding protein [Mesorhizobium sp. B2-4-12]